MKVNTSIYKGIAYIQVSALPPDQKEKLLQTINQELLIKILVDGKLVGNCLQYKDYETWFDNIYAAQLSPAKTQKEVKEKNSVPLVQMDDRG